MSRKNVLLRIMSAPAWHNQRWTILRQCKLSVETSGVVKIYIAEKLTLGSLPHVLKERALNSPVIACSINVSAGKREKYKSFEHPKCGHLAL